MLSWRLGCMSAGKGRRRTTFLHIGTSLFVVRLQ